MKTLTTIAAVILLAGALTPAETFAQLKPVEPRKPVKPAPSEGPREPGQGPVKPAPDAGPIEIEFEGIDGVLGAVAIDQDFAIVESAGRRLPQATVTLTREPDGFTAALLRSHTRGTRFKNVTITSTATGSAMGQLTVKLSDVVVEAVSVRASAGGAEEVVTLRFGKIWWSNGDGQTFEWNYATMTAR